MLALGTLPGVRTFRNNVGMAAAGRIEWVKSSAMVKVNAGDAIVRNARPFHAGLIKGSGDLIGWKSVAVTPEMVGQTVAVFLSVEVKDEKGKTSDAQDTWRQAVSNFGGVAIIARSETEALDFLK